MEPDMLHGWVELPSGAMMHIHEGIPDRVAVRQDAPHDTLSIAQEVMDCCRLHVRVGDFHPGALPEEDEADIDVDPQDLQEVLLRLARCSAQIFFDRYHKVLDEYDVDFEDEAFAHDMNTAIASCHASWQEIDARTCRDIYHRALVQANNQIAREWLH